MTGKWSFEEVPMEKVWTDRKVQREVNESKVNKLVKEWDDLKAGVPILSARGDGTYHVIDGQHSVNAMRKVGYTHVWAKVVFGLNSSREAEIFLGQNDRRAVVALQKFPLEVKAGDELAIALDAILSGYGWQAGVNKFAAIQTLKVIGRRAGGIETARKTIETLTRAWGNDTDAVKQQFVAGIGYFWHKFPDADMDKLVRQLQSVSTSRFTGLGDQRKRDSATGKVPQAYCNAAVDLYNKVTRGPGRLPFVSI